MIYSNVFGARGHRGGLSADDPEDGEQGDDAVHVFSNQGAGDAFDQPLPSVQETEAFVVVIQGL